MKKEKEKTFGIIGLGRFGTALALSLSNGGYQVIVLDEDENHLRRVRDHVEEAFLVGKLTKEVLEETGIGDCEIVIICIGTRIDVNILVSLQVINLGVPRVIAKADSRDHGTVLEKIGAEVVYPEVDTATHLSAVLQGSNALDIMALNGDYVVSEIRIPQKMSGRPVKDLQLVKHGLKILALERDMYETILDVDAETIIGRTDAVVVMGKFHDATRFERMLSQR
ncbi:MAG: TrkA family potassium uptake protein [Anaerovoracaceae bacterium]